MVPVGACDYNIKRVEAALNAGRPIPDELQITTPDGYSPPVHFAKIIAHRRAAAKQDAEQAARVKRFKELKEAELGALRSPRRRARDAHHAGLQEGFRN
jgi:hypothetical protein